MTSKQINSTQAFADAPIPGIYKHYKGNLYQVLGMARHSETEEWLVVYQALYGEIGYWLRPLSIWLEPATESSNAVPGQDTVEVIRFELL